MRIAIDCRFLGKSGIGTYIENIVHELIFNYPEHNYLLICYNTNQIGQHASNIQILETDIKPFSFKEMFQFPSKEINKCDAFFTPYINIPGRIKIPIYSTIHDVIFLDIPELTSYFGRQIRKWFMSRAHNKSKTIFTVSNFSKKRIEFYFGKNVHIVTTYNSISSSIKSYVMSHPVSGKKDNYIIYVGNIKRHKGLQVLIKAYTQALRDGYNKDLYIVGNAENFRTSDNEIGLSFMENSKIKFIGYLPNEKLYRMIAQADALILPTLYEGFGLPPLEALYLGTDVIISDIDVLKEIYQELPVSFFHVGKAEDLKEKLMKDHCLCSDVNLVRGKIDELYNKKNIANIILNEIYVS